VRGIEETWVAGRTQSSSSKRDRTHGTFACGIFCREPVVDVTNLAAHAGVQETDSMT
jgi:hypothetical protein